MDYTQYFETAKRKDTNEEYVFLKKCPENLRELIYSIHKTTSLTVVLMIGYTRPFLRLLTTYQKIEAM